MDRITDLRKRLARLKQLDRGFEVHGARGHRYKCRPLAVHQVDMIEQRAGHPLPDDLREWLCRVGVGAGPGYGLFRMGHRNRFQNWWTLKRSLGSWTTSPDGPSGDGEFPSLVGISKEDAELKVEDTLVEERSENGFPRGGPPKFTTRAYLGGDGILTLSHDGCSCFHVTPLVGPLKGKIFYTTEETLEDIDGVEHDWAGVFWLQGIVRVRTNAPFDDAQALLSEGLEGAFEFLDWIENWLDRETYLVENLDRYREQVQRRQAVFRKKFAEPMRSSGE